MYGPGSPYRALKHKDTSSITTTVSHYSAASIAFLEAMNSGVPCSSSRSMLILVMSYFYSKGEPTTILMNSCSFFLLPVMKVIGTFLTADCISDLEIVI